MPFEAALSIPCILVILFFSWRLTAAHGYSIYTALGIPLLGSLLFGRILVLINPELVQIFGNPRQHYLPYVFVAAVFSWLLIGMPNYKKNTQYAAQRKAEKKRQDDMFK